MISRYETIEISAIWNEENKYNTWLLIEFLVCEGWSKLGVIPNDDLKKIKANCKVDLKKMAEIEKETKHDVVSFTRMLSENLGHEKKWIHFGLTSTDIVDTAQNYLIKQSNAVIHKKVIQLMNVLKDKANEYKTQIILGRTHGIYAEPTSLGLKFLLWYEEFARHFQRLEQAFKQIEVVKISGSVGNFAHLELEIESYVAEILKMSIDNISTQVTQRDRHINLFSCFANVATSLEKMAIEFRLFQRSEVGEIMEGFSKNQKGSSSMPHKKNPIGSENISGLARLIRSNAYTTFENNLLWHERDISHSSNERIIIPDTYHLLDFTLSRMVDIIENIYVNQSKINEHLESCNNVFFGQRIMNFLILNNNQSREDIYDLIQKCSFEAMNNNKDLQEILINNGITNYISLEKLTELFDLNFYLRNINKIYERVLK